MSEQPEEQRIVWDGWVETIPAHVRIAKARGQMFAEAHDEMFGWELATRDWVNRIWTAAFNAEREARERAEGERDEARADNASAYFALGSTLSELENGGGTGHIIARLKELRDSRPHPGSALMAELKILRDENERLQGESYALLAQRNRWWKVFNAAERAAGFKSVAATPDAASLVEWCHESRTALAPQPPTEKGPNND